MSTVLKNILNFTGLAIGVPTSLPHLINVNGIAKIPRVGGANVTGFVLSADVTNVTVTRTAEAASGAVQVYVEFWHSIEDVEPPGGIPTGYFPFFFGSENGSVSAAPVMSFVYRPGATGASAPGGNVYTDWYALMAAITATKQLGYRQIQFDNTFAPDPNTDPAVTPFAAFNTILATGLNPGNKWPCAILPPPEGEAWDMIDVIWTDRGGAPGLDTSYVQIYDGGAGRPCRIDNLKRIDSMIFGIIYNGTTVGNHPFVVSRSTNLAGAAAAFYGWVFEGVRLRLYNTDASAQPVWISDAGTSFFDIQNNAVFGLNPFAPTLQSPAPVIEVASGATLVLFGKRTTSIQNNTFVGPVGATINIDTYFSEVWGSSRNPMFQWVMPNFLGAIAPAGITYTCATQRFIPNAAVLAANGNAFFGEVCRVNPTAGAMAVTLPVSKFTAPTTGTFPWQGTAITVQEVAGSTNVITVTAPAGETINGAATFPMSATAYVSARFWPDGAGAWFVIA